MDESSEKPTPQPEKVIEPPDLTDPQAREAWINKYVQIAFGGLHGTPEEQLEQTKNQIRNIAIEFPERGKSNEYTQNVLMAAVKPLYKGEDPK